jgi:uncharacterized protein (TIGR02147 family)
MESAQQSYREFLKDVLAEKVRKNPAYSLRAMASQLGLAPSTLSEVMNAKRNISVERANTLATKLGLSKAQKEFFCLLVDYEKSKSLDRKTELLERIQAKQPRAKFYDLQVDHFRSIADWYHSAIVELTEVKSFSMTPEAIGKELGIPTVEAEAALQRLKRLKLLIEDPPGRWRKASGHWLVESKLPNLALRRFHTQMLNKAVESLEDQSPQEKLIRTETLAINPKDLKKVEALMDEFFERVVAVCAPANSKTEVYHLSSQFFRISKGETAK